MTKLMGPFDTGVGASMYTAQWRKMFSKVLPDGAFYGYMNALQVYADASGMQVKVKSGGAWIQGHYYENDSEEVLAVTAAHPTLARWDQVVLQVDWTKTDNQISTAILAGTPAVSPTLPALTQSTSLWQIALAKIVVGAGVTTIAAGNISDLRNVIKTGGSSGGGGSYYLYNNSGADVNLGDVVVVDNSMARAFKLTSLVGDKRVLGVVTDTVIPNGTWGNIAFNGIQQVNVTGNVLLGDDLITSATPHYAKDASTAQAPLGNNLGMALSSYSGGGTGTVWGLIQASPSTSVPGLQQMPTQTTANNLGSTTLSWTHTVDVGTDLLVVAILTKKTSSTSLPTSVTFGAAGLDISNKSEYAGGSAYQGITYAFLRNPTPGPATITISCPAGTAAIAGVALGFIGSQPTPLRTPSAITISGTTTISQTPISAVGDLIIDGVNLYAYPWAPTGGQTVVQNWSSTLFGGFALKAGAAGTTTVSWGGALDYGLQRSCAIAGS